MNRPDTNQIEDFCQPGQGADTCRYLAMDSGGWRCLKHHDDARIVINSRVSAGTMKAVGDNCPGLREERTA